MMASKPFFGVRTPCGSRPQTKPSGPAPPQCAVSSKPPPGHAQSRRFPHTAPRVPGMQLPRAARGCEAQETVCFWGLQLVGHRRPTFLITKSSPESIPSSCGRCGDAHRRCGREVTLHDEARAPRGRRTTSRRLEGLRGRRPGRRRSCGREVGVTPELSRHASRLPASSEVIAQQLFRACGSRNSAQIMCVSCLLSLAELGQQMTKSDTT